MLAASSAPHYTNYSSDRNAYLYKILIQDIFTITIKCFLNTFKTPILNVLHLEIDIETNLCKTPRKHKTKLTAKALSCFKHNLNKEYLNQQFCDTLKNLKVILEKKRNSSSTVHKRLNSEI